MFCFIILFYYYLLYLSVYLSQLLDLLISLILFISTFFHLALIFPQQISFFSSSFLHSINIAFFFFLDIPCAHPCFYEQLQVISCCILVTENRTNILYYVLHSDRFLQSINHWMNWIYAEVSFCHCFNIYHRIKLSFPCANGRDTNLLIALLSGLRICWL